MLASPQWGLCSLGLLLVGFVQQLFLAKMENTTKNPYPSNVVPINTIIRRGRHLRVFPVNEKTWVHSCAQLDPRVHTVAHG